MNIQWFPGHMAKTRRLITEHLSLVDIAVELLDARIPLSSSNPLIGELIGKKPRVVALNKCDMADSQITAQWVEYYRRQGIFAVAVDSVSGKGFPQLKSAIRTALEDKIRRDVEKGMKERAPRMMVVGIPNVGKSTFINKLSGRAGAKTGDRPGVTTAKQWIRISGGYELLDTPGILWPRFEDERTGRNLAFTGAVKDDVYEIEEAACLLCEYLANTVPDAFCTVYKLTELDSKSGYDLLLEAGKRRGCLISGGEVDTERISRILLDEFRAGKLGRITLETPADAEKGE